MVTSVVISIPMIIRFRAASLPLITYGIIVTGVGLVPSILFKKEKILELIFLLDTDGTVGFSRAYVIGCGMILAGVIVKIYYYLDRNDKAN